MFFPHRWTLLAANQGTAPISIITSFNTPRRNELGKHHQSYSLITQILTNTHCGPAGCPRLQQDNTAIIKKRTQRETRHPFTVDNTDVSGRLAPTNKRSNQREAQPPAPIQEHIPHCCWLGSAAPCTQGRLWPTALQLRAVQLSQHSSLQHPATAGSTAEGTQAHNLLSVLLCFAAAPVHTAARCVLQQSTVNQAARSPASCHCLFQHQSPSAFPFCLFFKPRQQ